MILMPLVAPTMPGTIMDRLRDGSQIILVLMKALKAMAC